MNKDLKLDIDSLNITSTINKFSVYDHQEIYFMIANNCSTTVLLLAHIDIKIFYPCVSMVIENYYTYRLCNNISIHLACKNCPIRFIEVSSQWKNNTSDRQIKKSDKLRQKMTYS